MLPAELTAFEGLPPAAAPRAGDGVLFQGLQVAPRLDLGDLLQLEACPLDIKSRAIAHLVFAFPQSLDLRRLYTQFA